MSTRGKRFAPTLSAVHVKSSGLRKSDLRALDLARERGVVIRTIRAGPTIRTVVYFGRALTDAERDDLARCEFCCAGGAWIGSSGKLPAWVVDMRIWEPSPPRVKPDLVWAPGKPSWERGKA